MGGGGSGGGGGGRGGCSGAAVFHRPKKEASKCRFAFWKSIKRCALRAFRRAKALEVEPLLPFVSPGCLGCLSCLGWWRVQTTP